MDNDVRRQGLVSVVIQQHQPVGAASPLNDDGFRKYDDQDTNRSKNMVWSQLLDIIQSRVKKTTATIEGAPLVDGQFLLCLIVPGFIKRDDVAEVHCTRSVVFQEYHSVGNTSAGWWCP